MHTTEVIRKLQIKYPGCRIICLPNESPTEILCETELTASHRDYSIAISVLDRSVPHKHRTLAETYTIMSGELLLHVNRQTVQLKTGESYTILPGTVHWAEGSETWVHVVSHPGWTPADHIVVGQARSEPELRSQTKP